MSATIWLSDISTFDEMTAVWDAWMPKGTRQHWQPSKLGSQERKCSGNWDNCCRHLMAA
jgi:hypothetical protein